MYKTLSLCAAVLLFSMTLLAQTPCENGFAGIYPCENVNLLGFLSLSDMGATGSEANDIWGWTDPLDGSEYVVFGTTQGTSFVDISDPTNPIYLGVLPTFTSNSIWRDVKVFANHAFIVSEAGGHGMQVFDLTRLRNFNGTPEIFNEDAHYAGFGNAHNIAINEESGFAYCVGTGTFSGGLHIVDISDPTNPVIAGAFAEDGYTHDCQAVNYTGPDADHVGKELVFACNENTLTIVDVDDKTDCQQISRTTYTGFRYSHQGWLTEDQRYFLLDDELDESQFNHATKTYVWDVQDLDNPVNIGFFSSTENAIDHNLYIDGNLAFQSNYRAGLRILDVTDVANNNLNEVAYFDVYPASNSANFNGSWSNYPYFSSGVVALSHIEDGLFLLEPDFFKVSATSTDDCAEGNFTFDLEAVEGFAGPINYSVVGLPGQVDVSFSANAVTAPSTTQLTLSDFPNLSASYTIEILANGANFSYAETIIIETVAATTYFADEDEDGFGDPDTAVLSCEAIEGFVTNSDDCNDEDNSIYTGAPGTGVNLDNNCDGEVSGAEVNTCLADVNNDGMRDTQDLLLLISEFGCFANCSYDINDDGVNNVQDIILLIGVIGTPCN